MAIGQILKKGWNAFFNGTRDPTPIIENNTYYSTSYRPDRTRMTGGNEKTIITSVYNRIALDVASLDIRHIKTDDDGKYISDVKSGLNRCLTEEANIDQTGRALIQDIVMSMLDEGCVAVVPIETIGTPNMSGSYDVTNLRVAKIIEWRPKEIVVRVYNEWTGMYEELAFNKKNVAIIENPLYAVCNEQNSTLQRLIHKLVLLDAVDEQTSSGKLDLIIQLPYIIKTNARRVEAEKRRKEIEKQLSGSRYGIAYADGTEKITQLNRPVENNLLTQISNLQNSLYSQLGITQAILEGTADDKTMANYYGRTIEPIVTAIVEEMRRKFLTRTARTQNQTITYFRDPFKLIPLTELATIADTLTRNAIVSTNEIRPSIGLKPSKDPDANSLRNKNLNKSENVNYSNESNEPNESNEQTQDYENNQDVEKEE